jgi:hypothetical protein
MWKRCISAIQSPDEVQTLIGRVAQPKNLAPRQPRPVSVTTQKAKSTLIFLISNCANRIEMPDFGLL